MFVLNRNCTEQTEHDNYVPGVCFEQDVYGTKNIMMIIFVTFILDRMCMEQTHHDNYVPGVHLNRTCMQHTDHNDYVRGVHLEYDVYETNRSW